MISKLKVLGVAVASAALVAGLSGCITVTIQDKNANTNEPSASSNANNESANKNADKDNDVKDVHKNESSTSNSNSNDNWGRGDAEPVESTNKVGSAKVGYIQVPTDWKDRTTQDFDERARDASGVVYVVDPTPEFTSATLSHFAFASSIKMETYPTGFSSKLTEISDKFEEDTDNYSDPTWKSVKVAGHNAAKVTTEMLNDGVNVSVYAIDKDDTGSSCVILTGFSTPSNTKAIEGYMESWTNK